MKKGILAFSLAISAFYSMNAQDTTGVRPETEKMKDNSLLNVFPNPSTGTFQIIYSSTTTSPPDGWGGVLLINITNPNGKTVYTESIFDFDGEYNKIIDLGTQQKGVYIIEIVSGNQKKVKREVLN